MTTIVQRFHRKIADLDVRELRALGGALGTLLLALLAILFYVMTGEFLFGGLVVGYFATLLAFTILSPARAEMSGRILLVTLSLGVCVLHFMTARIALSPHISGFAGGVSRIPPNVQLGYIEVILGSISLGNLFLVVKARRWAAGLLLLLSLVLPVAFFVATF